ncbi:FAD-dependent oxidoreductase [Noviherbaspirillum sp. Root189]|uniref:FAD-dependent oxidoreductase n=1 Tax=Noviherbaspirillum sp. Root189 TaxID=1736487 RepID=UPI00070A7BB2|nr:FAD-dependent oxidoreductase [Noviherbaspirillum sp. Root189]KRB92877.1 Rubredoxin-NAD(+) reductase [Noviherbaspirillum sp. Root189]
MTPTIIIGTGMAGYTLAREFRKLDKTRPLLILTADDGGFYSKPMLSNAFAQGKSAVQLITQTAANMAGQLNVTIMTGTRVHTIDTGSRTVNTSSASFEYDKLILAVGAQPIRLAIEGDGAEDVRSVNHVEDYQQFRDAIDRTGESTRVTILGAGLIGCEFADDLAGAGHRVTLVDPNPLPLAALAAPALSRGLQSALMQRGVNLQLGTAASRIDRAAESLRVTLASGAVLDADIVLSAVGLRPDLRLAQAAGLATNRGILVDRYGRTSDPAVYALGDCTEYLVSDGRPQTLPYIAPLMTAARAIARTLTGDATAIDIKAAPVIVKTPSFPLALVPPPVGHTNGGWHETRDGERIVCRYFDHEGILLGFGVAPQEASVRQGLLAELGTASLSAA